MKKFLFVICFGFVSLLGFSNNVFAIDNLVYSSNSEILCTDHDCYSDGYRYIYVTSDNTGSESYIGLTVRPIQGGSSQSVRLYTSQTPLVLSVSPDFQYTLVTFQSGATGSIVFTDTYPTTIFPNDCPDCPEQEDCDKPFIIGLFESGFWGVATASVQLIVPILALFLVFRLIHDLLYRERL